MLTERMPARGDEQIARTPSNSLSLAAAQRPSGGPAGGPGRLLALQRAAGNRAIVGLLAGRARPVPKPPEPARPETVQRRVVITERTPPTVSLMDVRDILRDHPEADQGVGSGTAGAHAVADDMVFATGELTFPTIDAFVRDVRRRVVSAGAMRASQRPAHGLQGFGYPYREPARTYGPRVNHAAATFWRDSGGTGCDYAPRERPEDYRYVRQHPNDNDKAARWHDPVGRYEFQLTRAGRADPYQALVSLFTPQPPRLRSLIHCDYLVSLVQFRSAADAMGVSAFNDLVRRGFLQLALRYDGFVDVLRRGSGGRAIGSSSAALQIVHPLTPDELVIGDQVRFYNSAAYDVLTVADPGNWRLENALVVGRSRRGEHRFLGHGSGLRTDLEMREELAAHFNAYVPRATRLARAVDRAAATGRERAARRRLTQAFPTVRREGGRWFVVGANPRFGVAAVHEELRLLTPDDIPGLRFPGTFRPGGGSPMAAVIRPIEGRPTSPEGLAPDTDVVTLPTEGLSGRGSGGTVWLGEDDR